MSLIRSHIGIIIPFVKSMCKSVDNNSVSIFFRERERERVQMTFTNVSKCTRIASWHERTELHTYNEFCCWKSNKRFVASAFFVQLRDVFIYTFHNIRMRIVANAAQIFPKYNKSWRFSHSTSVFVDRSCCVRLQSISNWQTAVGCQCFIRHINLFARLVPHIISHAF